MRKRPGLVSADAPGPAAGLRGTPADRSRQAYAELERSVECALEYYSNVHRGTGHNSVVSTRLYELARSVVLRHLGLDPKRHTVVFCSPRREPGLCGSLRAGGAARAVSSRELGLPLGVRALAVPRRALPGGVPFEPGGGTIRLVSSGRVTWAGTPDRYEAGTPNIIGAIALGKALLLAERHGDAVFRERPRQPATPDEILHPDEFGGLGGVELLHRLRAELVGRGVAVPTVAGERTYVNLDNGASTPTFRPVWNAVRAAWRASEDSWPGLIREVRRICAEFLDAPGEEFGLTFAANTTEALNIAARRIRFRSDDRTEPVVLNTMLEHNSNELPWRYLPGVVHIRLGADREGFLDPAELAALLQAYNRDRLHGRQRIRLVAVCGASNVMGTYNDLPEIARTAHEYGASLLVDAAQLVAHRPVSMARDGIDFLAFSGHKMYAPFGSGGLVARRGLLAPGAGEADRAHGSGEENVAGIAALGKAALLLQQVGFAAIAGAERELTARLLDRLRRLPGVSVFGLSDPGAARFPRKGGVVCFGLKTVPHNLAAGMLAERGGIGVRTGCFCVNMYVKRLLGFGRVRDAVSHLILALSPRVPQELLVGLVRVSLGIENDKADVERLLEAVEEMVAEPALPLNRLMAGFHLGTPFRPRTATGSRIKELAGRIAARVYSDAGS